MLPSWSSAIAPPGSTSVFTRSRSAMRAACGSITAVPGLPTTLSTSASSSSVRWSLPNAFGKDESPMLLQLLTAPISLPLSGLRFILGQIADLAEQELYDEDRIRQDLLL